ncbi:MAG TPA: surface-adhesin E family protein [Nitrospiraceae bacterium]|nr:surface-adhesin E family protein [Nitrospiraceae bacterium]
MVFIIFWSLFAFIFFFLNSVPARAEWHPISYAAGSGGFTIYVDPDAILRQGDLVKMLVLYDFRFVQAIKGKSYLSATWQQQFDCTEHRSRHLSYTYHSDNMGNGKVMLAGDDEGNKWSPVAPKSAAAILWNIGCDKGRQPT